MSLQPRVAKRHTELPTVADPPAFLAATYDKECHRGAKVSKLEPNHPNQPNQFSGQNPNFRNSLRRLDRHEEHHSSLKVYARSGICKILPYYRDVGPNFWCAKGLDMPDIGLHTNGLDKLSGVFFLIKSADINAYVVWMISDVLICSLKRY